MLVRSTQRPKSNWAPAKLCEPTLQLRLGSIVRKTCHVKDLAALRQERTNISARIHWACQDVGVIRNRLGLPDQTSQDAGQCNCFLHRTTRGSWRKGLQVEGQVVLDGRTRLDRLDFERGADVGQHGWTEG